MKKNNLMLLSIFVSLLTMLSSCSKSSDGGGGGGGGIDAIPKISIADVSLPEGNSGTTAFSFLVTLDKTSTTTVSITCATADGAAKAGEDYTATSQTISFAPGEKEKTFVVNVNGDELKEGNEDFKVNLSSPVGCLISRGQAVGTIMNEDTKIVFNNTGYDAPTSYPGYTLVWSDEFNGAAVNTSDWTFENGDGCPGNCGWGNNELEFYQPANTTFQDGKMIIEARAENVGGKNYTSTKIVSRDKKKFKFGRIDFRALLPKSQGMWPAFWMMPNNSVYGGWPKSGELDIMEMIGKQPSTTYGTLHFGPGPGSTQLGGNKSLASGTFNDQFHVFSIEWKQDEITWLLDGVPFSTHTKAEFGSATYPFNEEFFFIINFAVGGNWPGNPDGTSIVPSWMIVDYVRVYQQ